MSTLDSKLESKFVDLLQKGDVSNKILDAIMEYMDDDKLTRILSRKLKKDLEVASISMTAQEARYLVDAYYIIQEDRKRSDNQVQAMGREGEPHIIIKWFAEQNRKLENQIKNQLDVYSSSKVIGKWMKDQRGIGPVIAAGFMSHLDITKAPTVGHFWAFAGLDPNQVWEKGQKRPWNAHLKTLCWKAALSFVRAGGDGYYNRVYRKRKEYEIANNEKGMYAEQAAEILKNKNYRDTVRRKDEETGVYVETENISKAAYKAGKLPAGHLDARARRYAVKLFLSHLHGVWYEDHFGKAPPLPYPIAHMDHVHFEAPPHSPFNK